jgi:hypothetical protein
MNTRDFLLDALKKEKKVSFLSNGEWIERDVKIIEVQDDDVCNKLFVYEVSNGDRYSNFENNITRLTDEILMIETSRDVLTNLIN